MKEKTDSEELGVIVSKIEDKDHKYLGRILILTSGAGGDNQPVSHNYHHLEVVSMVDIHIPRVPEVFVGTQRISVVPTYVHLGLHARGLEI